MGALTPSGLPPVQCNYQWLNDGSLSYLGPVNSVWVCPWYNRVRGWVGPSSYSYGYNIVGAINAASRGYLGLSGSWTNGVFVPIRESQVVNPSEMIALGDAVLVTDSIGGGGPIRGWLGLTGYFGDLTPTIVGSIIPGLPANDSAVRGMKQRHAGRWNMGFCDGHIESLRPSSLFNTNNLDQRRRWNNDHQPHAETL